LQIIYACERLLKGKTMDIKDSATKIAVVQVAPILFNCLATIEKACRLILMSWAITQDLTSFS